MAGRREGKVMVRSCRVYLNDLNSERPQLDFVLRIGQTFCSPPPGFTGAHSHALRNSRALSDVCR
jgi:hypothetical protein